MNKAIVGLVMGLVMAMPLVSAQQASVQTNAQAVSAINLRFRQFGEAFSDFVFAIKHVLTFSEDAKLELLKERNAELQTRQEAWLETKATALAQFGSTNMSAQEKQDIIAMIQTEHEAIIKEHLRLTVEIREIQLQAKSRSDMRLEQEAELEAEAVEESDLKLGLYLPLSGQVDINLSSEVRAVTAEEARAMVQREFGLTNAQVTTQVNGGITYYVVTGTEAETAGAYTLTKNVVVWIAADTGLITSVDLNTNISGVGIQTGTNAGGSIQASNSASASAQSGSSSNTGTQANTQTEVSTNVGLRVG